MLNTSNCHRLWQKIDNLQHALNRMYDTIWQFQNRLNELEILEQKRPLTNQERAAIKALQQGINDINQHLLDLQPQVLLERKRAELEQLIQPAFSA